MSGKKNFENIDTIVEIKICCGKIVQNNNDMKSMQKLKDLVTNCTNTIAKAVEPFVLSIFYPFLKKISENKTSFNTKQKELIINTLKVVLDKITLDKPSLYFNIYSFLLFEIYNANNHKVLDISEEYKLVIVDCMASLARSISSDLINEIYIKENSPKMCQMLYVLLNIAKNETFKSLRISAIITIMAIARVLDDDDFRDTIMRNQIAEMFLFFLPGLARELTKIALSDEKIGHKLPTIALKAWGRLVTLLMQDYNAADRAINTQNLQFANINITCDKKKYLQFNDNNDVKEYLENTTRSSEWYKTTDKNLQMLVIQFGKLTHHGHPKVRLELIHMASLLINNCSQTMPSSLSHLLEILITLSEDSDPVICKESRVILDGISQKFSDDEFKSILDNLEEGFYSTITGLPRKFNGIDEDEKCAALNLIIGYLNLFGKYSLRRVLHSSVHLNRLMLTLIHISEFDKNCITLLEEYKINDFEDSTLTNFAWKQFSYFKEKAICSKLEMICKKLANNGAAQIVSEFLLDLLTSDKEHHNEIIFLINEVMTGINMEEKVIAKNVITSYTDHTFWYVPLEVCVDDFGYEHTLGDIQNNIVHSCLLIEGISKIALALQGNFMEFLLKTLYLILERAGSGHALIRNCGLVALKNIATAGSYSSITELINSNIDYFAFHVERKLKRKDDYEGALNVLAVVMKFSSVDTLESNCNIVYELLMNTNAAQNEANLNAYFQVFKIFIQCLYKWLNIGIEQGQFKTKKQKQQEYEDFKVSQIEEPIESFSDESVMGKSAEELYKEDMEKKKLQIEEFEDENCASSYKKPDPPLHIKLVVMILTKSLHFLPSKKQSRKLLILEILREGVEILKDWEDELLPIVHQIWSPLVDRFKEFSQPVIINYSFQLIVVLSKLSKDFIRSRTSKEVFPHIMQVLDKYSYESYLKDKGSAYRYTQAYKLQLELLEKLPSVIMNLDMLEIDMHNAMNIVFKYISEKQPTPLQSLAMHFLDLLVKYDPDLNLKKLKELIENSSSSNEYCKNTALLLKQVENCK